METIKRYFKAYQLNTYINVLTVDRVNLVWNTNRIHSRQEVQHCNLSPSQLIRENCSHQRWLSLRAASCFYPPSVPLLATTRKKCRPLLRQLYMISVKKGFSDLKTTKVHFNKYARTLSCRGFIVLGGDQ